VLVVVAKLLLAPKDITNTIESFDRTLASGADRPDSDEVKWRYATDSVLVEYFLGENVWSKEWREVGLAKVLEPSYGKPRSFSIYAAEFADQTKQFVAGEATNGTWIFYIPSNYPDAS
jgi:hypothetical protein